MISVENPMDINRKIHLFKGRMLPTLIREYRFKTKEEFRKKYGEDWRYVLPKEFGFVEGMDHLLGKNLKDYLPHIAISVMGDDTVILRLRDSRSTSGYWVITPDMLIIRDEFHIYKTKEDEKVITTKTPTPEGAEKKPTNLMMLSIKNVVFNEKNKTTTVVLGNGRTGVSKCSSKDVYDKKIGLAMAYVNAVAGSKNKFQQVVDQYSGEAEKKRKEREYQRRLHSEMKLREYNEKQKITMQKAEEKRKKEAEQFEKDLAEYTKQYKQKKMEQAWDKEDKKPDKKKSASKKKKK